MLNRVNKQIFNEKHFRIFLYYFENQEVVLVWFLVLYDVICAE